MFSRFVVPAAAAVLMLATAPAMAAMTKADECTALQKQFDAAIVKHEKAAKAADAKALRTQGGQLCTSGKADEGVKKLQAAFTDIGVKPKLTK
jgi:hypothetical protein